VENNITKIWSLTKPYSTTWSM